MYNHVSCPGVQLRVFSGIIFLIESFFLGEAAAKGWAIS